MDRLVTGQYLGWRAPQYSRALRYWERVLQAVAGPPVGLYVRLLSDSRRDARTGPDGQDGSHLPQAQAEARRERRRSRMRLGSFGPAYGAAVWRLSESL